MGQILHPCARTTEKTRKEIQESDESSRVLAKRHSLNQKTILKWRKRTTVSDMPMGPKTPRSKSLSALEEAIAVAFRKHTWLPLDDCLYALQEIIPHLSRSSLHRCFQRHQISRIPVNETGATDTAKKKFKTYPVGYFHIDITEVNTEEGKLYLLVGIERVSKFTVVQLTQNATAEVAAEFLKRVIASVPFRIHTVLTDNGGQFTVSGTPSIPSADQAPNPKHTEALSKHIFEKACVEHNIRHRRTKPAHPWTNGQVERMNRTIKEATVRTYQYTTHEQLKAHLDSFIDVYNFAKRLKSLKGQTAFQRLCDLWKNNPDRFNSNPHLFFVGHNKYKLPPS